MDSAINQKSKNTVHTRMYEPVSDRISSPGYPHNRYTTVDVSKCNTNNSTTISPPEKPPRRNKLARQLQQQQQNNSSNSVEEKKCPRMRNGNGDSCIDVDNINIQSEKTFRIKRVSTAVQTSPLVPYRLRFWPKASGNGKCDPDKHVCSIVHFQCCCRTISQFFLSQIGLTLVLVLWALAGAAAFYYTEGPRELEQSKNLYGFQNELAINLATHLNLQLSSDSNRSVSESTIQHYLDKHEKFLLEAVSAGYGEGGGGRIWIYPGCILFAISLLTTLGFGAPVPRTPEGRGAAVLFAAIGIPLHFLLILNIGNLAAIKLQLFVLRKCATGFPENADTPTPQPTWFKWFPLILIAVYYILGVIVFGFARQRDPVDCFMFPLDFTAAGGVGKTPGYLRIFYGLYLEVAMMLASLVVSLLQVSASRGIINLGLKLGLLTNT